MRLLRHIFICLLFLALAFHASLVSAQSDGRRIAYSTTSGQAGAISGGRYALIIGNSRYASSPLNNPVNDAADVAAALTKLGFSVMLKIDASHEEMEKSLEEFGSLLRRGEVGLFYFAGHGIQINGINYLIPVNAKITKESDVRHRAINLAMVIDEMAASGNSTNIIILDACRDNPYARKFRSARQGLAMVTAPKGTFISYSTAAGDVAADGAGRNSPFTGALLQYISIPGLTIEQIFKQIRQKLDIETGEKQIPWEQTSLHGEFYFIPPNLSRVVLEKEFSYHSTNRENESSCITIAREKVKRELFEELAVRLETRARPGGTSLPKHDVISLMGGIVSIQTTTEKWDGKTCLVRAKVEADLDTVISRIGALVKDSDRAGPLKETSKQAKDALKEAIKPWNEPAGGKDGYSTAIQKLNAIDWFEKGYVAGIAGNNAEAIRAFEAATRQTPGFAFAYFNLGFAHYCMMNYGEAISNYTRAIELNPKLEAAYVNRGLTYEKTNDLKQALNDYSYALVLNPVYVKALENRGTVYAKMGQNDFAIQDLSKVIELNPKNAKIFHNRGILYTEKKSYEKALEDFNRAIVLNSRYAEAYYYRGVLYDKLRNTVRATDDLKVAARLGSKNARAYLSIMETTW